MRRVSPAFMPEISVINASTNSSFSSAPGHSAYFFRQLARALAAEPGQSLDRVSVLGIRRERLSEHRDRAGLVVFGIGNVGKPVITVSRIRILLKIIFEYRLRLGQSPDFEQVITHSDERFVAEVIGLRRRSLQFGMVRQSCFHAALAHDIPQQIA